MENSLIWFARFFKLKNVQKVFIVILVILPIAVCLPFILEIFNGPTGIICIISASLVGIYLYMDKIAREYYKPYVYINKKFITPNIVFRGYSAFDLGRMDIDVRKKLLYTPCKTCLRKDQCTVTSSSVRQCDLYKEVVNEILFSEVQNLRSFEEQRIMRETIYEPMFSSFIDNRDGNVYKTVKIGGQIWMAENLKYIPHICPVDDNGGIWVYDYNGNNIEIAISTEYYKKFGCLYDCETAISACPEGWHLSTDDDWDKLIKHLGGENFAEIKLKSGIGWNNHNTEATNESGFSALPGGYRNFIPFRFCCIESSGYWWSPTDNDGYFTTYRSIGREKSLGYLGDGNNEDKRSGFSVRCVKNN